MDVQTQWPKLEMCEGKHKHTVHFHLLKTVCDTCSFPLYISQYPKIRCTTSCTSWNTWGYNTFDLPHQVIVVFFLHLHLYKSWSFSPGSNLNGQFSTLLFWLSTQISGQYLVDPANFSLSFIQFPSLVQLLSHIPFVCVGPMISSITFLSCHSDFPSFCTRRKSWLYPVQKMVLPSPYDLHQRTLHIFTTTLWGRKEGREQEWAKVTQWTP